MDEYESMIEYYPECKQDLTNELHFPNIYSDASDIQIIQPMYDNLQKGQEVKFIIKSSILNEIVIIGDKPYYVNKNNEGYFEQNIKIGEKCGICKKNEKGKCIYLVKYNI